MLAILGLEFVPLEAFEDFLTGFSQTLEVEKPTI
jgi:hypothetical protein